VRYGLTTGQYGRDKTVRHDKPTSRKTARELGHPIVYNLGSHQGHPPNHWKWKTKTITKRKTTKYAHTKPNLRHPRLDFGHHAQHANAASKAFGIQIRVCNHVGHSE
jgi:hypothetical protein